MNFLRTFVDRVSPIEPPVLGLDISDRTVKAAFTKKTRHGVALAAWDEESLLPGVIETGLVKNDEAFAESLRRIVGRFKARGRERWAVVALPEEEVFIRLVTLPTLAPEALKKAVALEFEATIPLAPDDVYTDWFPFPWTENGAADAHQDVILVAAAKKIVDGLSAVFKRAGIRVVAIEPTSHALARIVLRQEPAAERETFLVVDLGALSTRLALMVAGVVNFSTTFAVSGEGMTEALAQSRHIEFGEAESFKQRVGIGQTVDGRATFQILEPALKEITRELQQAVRYWGEHVKHRHGAGKDIAKIILTGGGANLKGLTDFLSFHVGVPAEPLRPWEAEESSAPIDALAYATALGLALRAL